MNYTILFKLQSIILMALAISFALCGGVALIYQDGFIADRQAASAFFLCFIISATLAGGFAILGKGENKTFFKKEALATIGIGWIIASLIGALPYYFILPDKGFSAALFESASGLTTTGASILSDLEQLPRSLHLWRAMSQWMGGLGVVVFFVAVLSFLGAGAKVLFSRESSAQATDLGTSRVQKGISQLLIFYLSLSLACFLAYWMVGLDLYEALIHMLSTVSTGGFSTRSASIADFQNPVFEWIVIFFMILGGTNFLVLIKALQGHPKSLIQSTEVKSYYIIVLLASSAIFLFLTIDPKQTAEPLTHLRDAVFQVVSIMTSTGYATKDYTAWLPVTHILILALMVVGGCSGSTAGGTKVIRFIISVKMSLQQIEKSFRTRVIRPLKVNGKTVSPEDQETVLMYIVILGLIIFSSTLIVAFLEPNMSFPGIISSAASCLFNVGPGLAEVGPANNFANLHAYTLIYLSFLMILGRLELFALLVLFIPSLWKQY